MIKISINGLTVEGGNEKEFTFALSQVANVAALASEHAQTTTKGGAIRPPTIATDYAAVWLGSKLNTESLKPLTRYRMTEEEISAYGKTEEGRQESARERLIAGGVLSGKEGDALQGESVEGAQLNQSLVDEFN